MAIVTRKYTCKQCETTLKVTHEQRVLPENPQSNEEFLLAYGMCKSCFQNDKID